MIYPVIRVTSLIHIKDVLTFGKPAFLSTFNLLLIFLFLCLAVCIRGSRRVTLARSLTSGSPPLLLSEVFGPFFLGGEVRLLLFSSVLWGDLLLTVKFAVRGRKVVFFVSGLLKNTWRGDSCRLFHKSDVRGDESLMSLPLLSDLRLALCSSPGGWWNCVGAAGVVKIVVHAALAITMLCTYHKKIDELSFGLDLLYLFYLSIFKNSS